MKRPQGDNVRLTYLKWGGELHEEMLAPLVLLHSVFLSIYNWANGSGLTALITCWGK